MRYILIILSIIIGSGQLSAQINQPGIRASQITGGPLIDSVLYLLGTDTTGAKIGLGKFYRADSLGLGGDTDWYKLGGTLIPTNSDSAYRSGYTLLTGLNGGIVTKIEMLKDGILQFDNGTGQTVRYLMKYKPFTSGATSFNVSQGKFTNPYGSKDNEVVYYGWNIAPGGSPETAGKSMMAIAMENFFRPNIGEAASEWHVLFTDTLGTAYRPLTMYLDQGDATNQSGAFQLPDFEYRNATDLDPYIKFTNVGGNQSQIKMLDPVSTTGMQFLCDPGGSAFYISNQGMSSPIIYENSFFATVANRMNIQAMESTPDQILGRNSGDKYVGNITTGWGVDLTGGVLLADSSQVATQYDLTLISGGTTNLSIAQSGGTQVIQSSTGTDVGVRNLYGLLITEGATDTLHFKVDTSLIATSYDITQIPISSLKAAAATNTINNANYAQEWQWNTLAGTTGLKLSSTSTAAASNAQKLFESSLSGANGTASQATYAGYFSNTHTGSTPSNYGVYGTSSSVGLTGNVGAGVSGRNSAGGIAVEAITTSGGYGLYAESPDGYSIYANTTNGTAGALRNNWADNSSYGSNLDIYRNTSNGSNGAAGIGGGIAFYTETSTGATPISNQIKAIWTTATNASRTSSMVFTGVNSTTEGDILTLKGSKQLQMHGYGTGGTFTASPVADLFVDATGNVVQGSMTGQSWTADADDATAATLVSNQTLKFGGASGITTDLYDNVTTDSITFAVNGAEFTTVTTAQSDDYVLLHDSGAAANEKMLYSDFIIDIVGFKDGNASVGSGNTVDVGEGLDISMSPSTEANINFDCSEFQIDGATDAGEYVLIHDSDTTAGHQIQRRLVSSFTGGTDTNFAEDDLTFTGNRSHDLGANTLLLHGTVGNVTFEDDNGGTGNNVIITSEVAGAAGITGGISYQVLNSAVMTELYDIEANQRSSTKSTLSISAEQNTDSEIILEKNSGLSANTTASHLAINGGIAFTQNYDLSTTGNLTIDRSYNILNITGGAVTDTIKLPEVASTTDNWDSTITDAQAQVGQEYVVTNFRSATNLVIAAYNSAAGNSDLINTQTNTTGWSAVSIAPNTSVQVRCVRLASGVGYWYTY
jgi:hypothetical protein